MTLLVTSPAGLDRRVETCQGTVTVDGILMHRLGWELFDLSALYGQPALRGSNRILPSTPGVVAYPMRLTESRYSLPLLVTGHWDVDDDYSDPDDIWSVLADNVAFLMANVLLPPGVAIITRTFEWAAPNGDNVTAEVQVLESQPPVTLGSATQISTMEILVPDGDLHL